MANEKQVALLKQGSEVWNAWRRENPDTEIYLGHTDLHNAKLSNTDLRNAKLFDTNLFQANFSGANLSGADLSGADLSYANLSYANLRGALLYTSRVLDTNFKNATLTGACIEDWHITASTNLEGVKCDYIFRTYNIGEYQFAGRLPVNPDKFFALSEFEQWMRVRQGALDTIDITFGNGIDWQEFFQSLQITRQQHPDANVVVKAIEEENGIFVARLKIQTDTTGKVREQLEAEIETQIKASYEQQLAAAQGEIRALERSLDKTLEKFAMTNKYTFNGPVNNVADINHGTMIGYINQNGEAISQLITALRSSAQSFPTEQKEEVLMELEDLERDLSDPQKVEPKRILKRLQRIIGVVLGTAATIAGTAVTLSGDVNEITENVLKIGENAGLTREMIMGDQSNPKP